MDLRKTCNHPLLLDNAHFRGLLPPAPVEELVADSGKLAVLDPMLRKLKAAGHRTLIYSQFTMVCRSLLLCLSQACLGIFSAQVISWIRQSKVL